MDPRTSAYYSQNASKLAEQYATVIHTLEDCLASAFTRSHKILDVGCGTGRDLAFLLGNGKDAYGVDPSEEMLGAAHQTLEVRGFSGEGRLFVGSLPDLSQFGESEFDGVLCSAVLMHLPEEELFDAVYALRRVLRPGGTLLVSVPAKRNDIDAVSRRDACEVVGVPHFDDVDGPGVFQQGIERQTRLLKSGHTVDWLINRKQTLAPAAQQQSILANLLRS